MARRRKVGARLAGPCIAVLVLAGSLEAALRLGADLLPPRIGNRLYSVYGTGPAGIYFRPHGLRMNLMRPSHSTWAYYNGRWWWHATDALGFRNPEGLDDRSLVLLGDSMIYGHAVAEEETVAHVLRAERGLPAYNMGRQGDSLYQEYVLARLFFPKLRPRVAVLFVFLNDFADLEVYRTRAELADPPELEGYDYDALYERLRAAERRSSPGRQLERLRAWRLIDALGKEIAAWLRARPAAAAPVVEDPAAASGSAPPPPAVLLPILDDRRFEPLAAYYRTILGDLARRCRAQGTELVVALLDVGDEVFPASAGQDRIRGLLEEIGRDQGLRVLQTREVFAGCRPCFLPGDGHLSGQGHRRLATFVADALSDTDPSRKRDRAPLPARPR